METLLYLVFVHQEIIHMVERDTVNSVLSALTGNIFQSYYDCIQHVHQFTSSGLKQVMIYQLLDIPFHLTRSFPFLHRFNWTFHLPKQYWRSSLPWELLPTYSAIWTNHWRAPTLSKQKPKVLILFYSILLCSVLFIYLS